MPSQFFGLTIGYSGLNAYSAALNTTGNNIANVETEGYSRQKITQQAANALRTYTSYGMAGAGTVVTSIDQVRDSYYDVKYRNATTSLGEYEVKSDYMLQIENYFNDDGDTTLGFSTLYDSFYTALEEVQKNPGDTATRSAFISNAQQFADYFNSMSSELTSLQEDVNDQVKNAVDQINSIAAQIATLNKQINVIEMKGVTANELRDQRNLLVDQLSEYVDVTISEDPIYSDAACTVESGAYRYIVTISDTQTLVDGYDYRTLDCVSRETGNKVNQSDAEGLYDIYWHDTGMKYYPVGTNYSGSLKGLLQVRDGNNNEAFRGTVVTDSYTPASTDAAGNYTNATIQVRCDKEYLTDVTKLTLNGTGTISIKNVPYKYDSWECTIDETTGESVFTFKLSGQDQQENQLDSIAYYDDLGNEQGIIGTAIDYQGIPYYMEQMNEWLRVFSQTFNDIEESGEDLNGEKLAYYDASGNYLESASAGDTVYDHDGNAIVLEKNYTGPTAFFVSKDVTGYREAGDYCFAGAENKAGSATTYTFSSSSDSYYQLTAATFRVNTELLNDASKMSTTASQASINLEAHDIVDELEDIKDQKNFFRGCKSSEFLSCVLGDVALNTNSANTFLSNYENIQGTISNQRLSVSGVDDDEEALDLVKYQNAYNLSAKMIQVMTEVYDKLIEETGV